MVKTKSKLDDLVEKNKDLDPTYVNNILEEYDEFIQYYSILRINNRWMMPMLNLIMNGGSW
jgi:hypothetical protein